MRNEDLVAVIDSIIRPSKKLEFEGNGVIRPAEKDITKIGVCVDLTDHVAAEAKRLGIDQMVVHHYFADGVIEKASSMSTGLYGSHLPLDTMPDGLIDSFASVFGVNCTAPVSVNYKGHEIGNAAVLLRVGGKNIGYFFDRVMSELSHLGSLSAKVVNYRQRLHGNQRRFERVIVSAGTFIRPEFMQQLQELDPHLYIAGNAGSDSEEYARSNGIAFMTIGDFESHAVGMQRFADRLRSAVNRPGMDKMRVYFIPNYKT